MAAQVETSKAGTRPPTLNIVIVSYNCRDALRQCLTSLSRLTGREHTSQWNVSPGGIVVVDNASTDGTADVVRAEFPAVSLIANAANRGFAAACNQGIRARPADFVLLLNPDATVQPDTIDRLMTIMQGDPRIGACGPRLLHPNGKLQPSCRRFPSLAVAALAELGIAGPYRMRWFEHDATRKVDQLMGACLLVRTEARDGAPLFDERFFLYFEEVDLCLRLKRAGWNVVFVHDATVTHVGGQSSKTARDASLLHRYRSLAAFYRKHYPAWQLPVVKLAVWLGASARVVLGQGEYRHVAREVWRL